MRRPTHAAFQHLVTEGELHTEDTEDMEDTEGIHHAEGRLPPHVHPMIPTPDRMEFFLGIMDTMDHLLDALLVEGRLPRQGLPAGNFGRESSTKKKGSIPWEDQ
jgi:hypothetical protein